MLGTLVAVLLATAGASRFTADLVLTNQPGAVFMSWEQGSRIAVASVNSARRGEPVATLVTFADCTPNKGGNCDVKMDIRVYDPAGKVYGETRGTEVWVDKAPPPGTTQLAVGYMMIRIEPHDPSGRYRVAVAVTDHVSGVVLRREALFDVAPAKAADSPKWPASRPKPDLAGFWRDHCEDDFGLKIAPAGGDLYSISFCGPGGCFEPGTYRPNSPIFGDHSYRVIDADTIEVLGGDGFSTYRRCQAARK